MATIIMDGWREGLQKVDLTFLQQQLLNLRLKEAKENTDKLLKDEIVKIKDIDFETAQMFTEKAFKIGVNCRVE